MRTDLDEVNSLSKPVCGMEKQMLPRSKRAYIPGVPIISNCEGLQRTRRDPLGLNTKHIPATELS